MRLFNQTKNNLAWSMGGEAFACEPYGSLVVDDALLEPIRSRGLPLGVAPVPPEVKAVQRVAEAEADSKNGELATLRAAVVTAQAEANAARQEVELASVATSRANERATVLERDLAAARSSLESAQSERLAAEALLEGQAGAESQAVAEVTKRAALAVAAEQAASGELAKTRATLESVEAALKSSRSECEALAAELVREKADKRAANELLEETAGRAVEAEKRADTTEAKLREQSTKKLEKRDRA